MEKVTIVLNIKTSQESLRKELRKTEKKSQENLGRFYEELAKKS